MIFADKLIRLRKQAGLSQEDLANELNISRQSVSKWEQAQSFPDLDKIIQLSTFFNVSTDYLIKDEIENGEDIKLQEFSNIRKISMAEAREFLDLKKKYAPLVSLGVSSFITSPVILLILSSLAEEKYIRENLAAGLGVSMILIFVALGIAILIYSDSKQNHFNYLEKEQFETEYGVKGLCRQLKENYRSTYTKNIVLGISLCILSVVPLLITAIFTQDSVIYLTLSVCLILIMVSIGVNIIVRTAIISDSYKTLLQIEDFSPQEKKVQKTKSLIFSTYWLIAVAIFLGYSLTTNNWHISWIVFVVAGVLFPIVAGITNILLNKD